MKYFVVSDVHSFYTPFMKALDESGFFTCSEPRKLIICGDFFDRGGEALLVQKEISRLLDEGDTILLRGNHEDLMVDMLEFIEETKGTDAVFNTNYRRNGTIQTLCDLTGSTGADIINDPQSVVDAMRETVAYTKIFPAAIDYLETSHYVFTHGWIPCEDANARLNFPPVTFDDWRNANKNDWKCARWMDYLAGIEKNVKVPGKTIVCGHRSTRYGNVTYNKIDNPDHVFDPFFYDGLIAIDATTVLSGKVNCLVLEDD